MTSLRARRVGASLLLSLVLTAGLSSSAFAASPANPTPGPAAAPTVASTVAAAPATTPNADSGKAVCLPPGSPKPQPAGCPVQAPPPPQTGGTGAVPATSGYTISGTVTTTGGTGIVGVYVEAYIPGTGTYGDATTTSGGNYEIDSLIAGSYVVYFYGLDPYVDGYYDSGVSPSHFTVEYGQATYVVVNSGTPVQTGISVQIPTGHHIQGTITGPGGTGLPGISVYAYDGSYFGSTSTSSDGTYSVLVPDSGTYTVAEFDYTYTYLGGYYCSGCSGHFTQTYASATPVQVNTSDVTGIDIQTALTPPFAVTIAASQSIAAPGTWVTLTATTNQDVGFTGYYIVILSSGGTVENYCSSGTTCSEPVSLGSGSETYHAVIADSDGIGHIQATSGPVTVHWTLDHLVLSPAGATTTTGLGQAYTAEGFDASSNDLGDVTSDTIFDINPDGSCTGATCTPINVGDHLVSGSDGTAIGSTTLHVVVFSGATYHTVSPARVLDSRPGIHHIGATQFHSKTKQTVLIANGSSGVPTDAVAVTGNVTVTGQKAAGFVTVAPSLTSGVIPGTSTINFPTGDNRANGVTVPLASGGNLDFMYWTGSTSDTIDIIFDVTGYFS
jgi:hypothetical protein